MNKEIKCRPVSVQVQIIAPALMVICCLSNDCSINVLIDPKVLYFSMCSALLSLARCDAVSSVIDVS